MFPIVPTISLWFTVFVLVMAVLLVFAVQTAGRQLNESTEVISRWSRNTVIALVIFLVLMGFLAFKGVLLNFDRFPPPIGIVVLFSSVITVILTIASKWGTRLAQGLSFQILIGFQAFRVIVELFLFQLQKYGIAPIQMTFEGRNWDILTGILALLLFLVQSRMPLPKWILVAFNTLGLGLVLNVVIVGMVSLPTPFRIFMNEPANTFIAYLPFVWLPVFLVQIAIGGHILSFRKLMAKS